MPAHIPWYEIEMSASPYDEKYYREQMLIPDATFETVARSRSAKIQKYLTGTESVFEFGVGNGVALAYLQCAERHGYDINPSATAEARQRGIHILPSIEGIESRYDVIFSHHCLEHVTNPAECLSTLRRMLRPNGKLILFVPYEPQRRFRKHLPNDPNHHLFSWTPHTLTNLLNACGFTVQEARLGLFGYDRIAARLADKLHIGNQGFRLLRLIAHLLRPEREIQAISFRR